MKKITQKQLAFYLLYRTFKNDPTQWVKVWEFIGEIEVVEIGLWGFMSYTCPHRAFEVYDENPGLIEREMTTGKTGARYYQYRIAANPDIAKIKDEKLVELYKKIRRQPTLV